MATFARFQKTKGILLFNFFFFILSSLAKAQNLPPAAELTSQIKIGWNLGNTLEATGGETSWGNPMANQQLISAVKAAGFNAIRIPCAWDIYANQDTLDIDPAWLNRVQEVVDYAINEDMYVILNIHWDGGWLEEHPFYEYQEAVNTKQHAYWTQIANHFKDYGAQLFFAGTNEVHADYGTPTTEHITVQESYNQTFIDAVRATGGNNASRTLVVQTYNTNMQHGINYFSLPNDTINNRLVVEVHNYDPYDFTLNPNGSCLYWGSLFPSQSACTWGQEAYFDNLFAQVRAKWIDQGIPVIIGEYGVATKPNLSMDSKRYYLQYFNQVASANGIKTFYWDTGIPPSQNNGFAIFERTTGAIIDQGTLDAVMGGTDSEDSYTVSVSMSGQGLGSVTSNPNGIDCGVTCTASFESSTVVTLTASASEGSNFVGWDGHCTGSGPCSLTMIAHKNVTAIFAPKGEACENPITFSGNTGNFGTTEAICYRTNDAISGWGCYNFDGRSTTVSGIQRACGEMPLLRADDGYIYFNVSSGDLPWAGIYTW